MSAAATVIFALGNRSRGDDALGPMLLERLEGWLGAQGRAAEFELIDDFQLHIEHVLDLRARRLALFLDAGTGLSAALAFARVRPAPGELSPQTHALRPSDLLALYRRVEAAVPPPAFVLCVRGERFALGEGLSPSALVHLEQGWSALVSLCAQPDPARWQRRVRRNRLAANATLAA